MTDDTERLGRLRTELKSALRIFCVLAILIVVAAILSPGECCGPPERSRAAEAINFLATIHCAQERHVAREGTYASDLSALDVTLTAPTEFILGPLTPPPGAETLEEGWLLSLTREDSLHGRYIVTFGEEGFVPDLSTIPADISPLSPGS